MIRAGLVAALVMVSAMAASPAPAAAPAYVVTTLNVKHTLAARAARHDLAQAQRGADLVATQEMGSRHARRFTLPGFRSVQPGDKGPHEYAIYWRTSTMRYAGSFPILLHVSHLFRSATRYALAAVFRPRAGGCVVLVNLHMIPHIEHAGRPRALPRRALAARAIRRLAYFTHAYRQSCGLVYAGDWNIDGYADRRVRSPIFPAARLGLASSWSRFPHAAPTLGRRHVDGFYFAGIRPASLQVFAGTRSDHNGVRLRFRL